MSVFSTFLWLENNFCVDISVGNAVHDLWISWKLGQGNPYFSSFIHSFIHWVIHSFVRSFFRSVARHTTLPEPLPEPQSAIKCFLFQFPYPPFSSSFSRCLPPRLPVTSLIPSIFLSLKCLRRQFLRKMWPILSAFLLFIVCRMFLSPPWLVTLLHFSHDRSKWNPTFCITTFRNFSGISDLLSEMSKF